MAKILLKNGRYLASAGLSLALVAAIGAILALAWMMRSPLSSGDINLDLQRVVSQLVEGDASIKNCVLSVRKGDGSLDWSGAAGIARQRDQRLMSKDTPIFIASVTKLYTATAVMLLVEKGALSLDDPMAKYAARHCSDWAGRRLFWQDTFRPAGRDYRPRRARVECNPTLPQESNRLYGRSRTKSQQSPWNHDNFSHSTPFRNGLLAPSSFFHAIHQ